MSCFASWREETYGHHTDEYFVSMCVTPTDSLCLLEDAHDGPHEWTPTSDIMVEWKAEAQTPESE